MKKNTSWKFTDESSVTFQSSVSGPGEFGQDLKFLNLFNFFDKCGPIAKYINKILFRDASAVEHFLTFLHSVQIQ